MKKLLLIIFALVVANGATAQAWRNGAGVHYSNSPIIGDGVDRVAEIFTSTQGGDPPATLAEPAYVSSSSVYTVTDWLSSGGIDRFDNGEAKFRIACNYTKSGQFDAILFPGQSNVGHLHTFAGNMNVNNSSDYVSLRTSPASTCDGGPAWSQGYWAPALLYTNNGVTAEVIPNNHTFYYHEDYSATQYLIRLIRGSAFIAGANPADRLNTAQIAELPAGWDTTQRRNGWTGWGCFKVDNGTGAVTIVSPAVGNTADENPEAAGYLRQFQNADGTDPYAGACEPGAGYKLIMVASLEGPKCWDGITLKGNGRGQWRWPARKSDNSVSDACPDYSWRVPSFSDKIEYSNFGWNWRKKLTLASDCMAGMTCNPPGSTEHIDWMYGTDDYVFFLAERECMGVRINNVRSSDFPNGVTCGNGTISGTLRLKGNGEAPPVAGLSNNPIVSLVFKSLGPSKYQYGPVLNNTPVGGRIQHPVSLMSAPAPKAVVFNWGAWLIILTVIGGSAYLIYRRRQQ